MDTPEIVKLVVFVPLADADRLRQALGDAGAGIIGNYTHCSFSSPGIGRFLAGVAAKPHIGTVGALESVEEERVEVVCKATHARRIIDAARAVHPYEEMAFDIYPLLTINDLP